jgi:hypothetical protein
MIEALREVRDRLDAIAGSDTVPSRADADQLRELVDQAITDNPDETAPEGEDTLTGGDTRPSPPLRPPSRLRAAFSCPRETRKPLPTPSQKVRPSQGNPHPASRTRAAAPRWLHGKTRRLAHDTRKRGPRKGHARRPT